MIMGLKAMYRDKSWVGRMIYVSLVFLIQ
uniref:Uncharacterized protein n=1 Tax=Anguilla anguilla TaxID=7936 RepID=A0A0E9SZ94_ANGAN